MITCAQMIMTAREPYISTACRIVSQMIIDVINKRYYYEIAVGSTTLPGLKKSQILQINK
jgi:hypothetical protein